MPFVYNPLTGNFDITSAGGGDAGLQAQIDSLDIRVTDLEDETQKITAVFTPASFVLVAGQYIFTVTASAHLKDSPIVSVYEVNGSDFDEVTASIKILANKDVQLIVPQVPDIRFTGKLIIS